MSGSFLRKTVNRRPKTKNQKLKPEFEVKNQKLKTEN